MMKRSPAAIAIAPASLVPRWVDGVAAAMALAVASFSGWFLWTDASLVAPRVTADAPRRGKPVATIAAMTNAVRHKQGERPLWDRAEAHGPLFARDQIFTDETSTADVAFRGGTRIHVGQNTLITVEARPEAPVLDLRRGHVRTSFTREGSVMTFRFNGQETRVSAGPRTEMAVTLGEDGQADVLVVRGEAKIRSGDRDLPIGERQYRRIGRDGRAGEATRLAVTLRAPGAGRAEWLTPARRYGFRWDLDPGAAAVRLEAAEDDAFTRIVAREEAPRPDGAALTFPGAGSYRWRLWVKDAAGRLQASEARAFTLLAPTPPTLLWPVGGTVDAPGPVALRWAEPGAAGAEAGPGYVVEVARDAAFRDAVARGTTTDRQWLTPRLAAGTYHWRVVRSLGGRALTAAAEFRVADEAAPAATTRDPVPTPVSPSPDAMQAPAVPESAPVPEEPPPLPDAPETLAPPALGPGYEIRLPDAVPAQGQVGPRPARGSWWETSAFAEEAPSDTAIQWPPVAGARAYVVEVGRDPGFAETVLRVETLGPSFDAASLDPGPYVLRIATRDAAGRLGAFSPAVALRVKPGRMAASAPAPRARMAASGAAVAFRWKAPRRVTTSRLLVTTDAAGRRVAHEASCACEAADVALPPGTYHWRVRGWYANGAEAEPSAMASFTLDGAPKSPPQAVLAPPPPLPPIPQVMRPLALAAKPLTVPAGAPAPTDVTAPAPQRPPRGRIVASLAPSHVRYAAPAGTMGMDATIFNSFGLAAAVPLGTRWGLALRGQRMATWLYPKGALARGAQDRERGLIEFRNGSAAAQCDVLSGASAWEIQSTLGAFHDTVPLFQAEGDGSWSPRPRGVGGGAAGVLVAWRWGGGERLSVAAESAIPLGARRTGLAVHSRVEAALAFDHAAGARLYRVELSRRQADYRRGDERAAAVATTSLGLGLGLGF